MEKRLLLLWPIHILDHQHQELLAKFEPVQHLLIVEAAVLATPKAQINSPPHPSRGEVSPSATAGTEGLKSR